MKPMISVITAVLNEVDTIESTLDSLRSQTISSKIEHIVVDGGSTDGSLDNINRHAELADFPVIVVRQSDVGIYSALNQGINLANGEIIAILHANDRYTNTGVLELVSEAFTSDIAAVYGDSTYEGNARYYSARRFSPNLLKIGLQPSHPSFFVRKKIYDEIGLFDTQFPTSADFDFYVRLFLKHKLRAKYLPIAFTSLTSGGFSAKLKNRLFYNNLQKYKSLRMNGYRICPLMLLGRYIYLFDK